MNFIVAGVARAGKTKFAVKVILVVNSLLRVVVAAICRDVWQYASTREIIRVISTPSVYTRARLCE